MAVNLTIFPLELSNLGANTRYNTDIFVGKNGNEVRNANWQDPLRTFNAGFAVKTQTDIELLEKFFHGCKGREQSFLLKDFTDFAVSDWTTFAESPNGSRTTFQLIKKYTESVLGTHTRTITKPKTGTITARVNGTNATITTSLSTGIVTFATAPGSGTTVDFKCEFYVPVRFDTDEFPKQLLEYWIQTETHAVYDIPTIPLIEVRE